MYYDRNKKIFVKIGDSLIDIMPVIGLSFYKDPYAYTGVLLVMDTGKYLNVPFKNRNQFSLFLLQLDKFTEEYTIPNIDKFIDEIETTEIDMDMFNNKNGDNDEK